MDGILRQRVSTRIATALVGIVPLIGAASSATAQEETIHERSFEGYWETTMKPTLVPDFVEWVEEQRAKAA